VANQIGPKMGARRQAFESYYKSHPEKLKGKTTDQAYEAMQREATRQSRENSSTRHGPGKTGPGNLNASKTKPVPTMAAVERRLSGSKNKGVFVGNPLHYDVVPGTGAAKKVMKFLTSMKKF
jgi:hypothetical protein